MIGENNIDLCVSSQWSRSNALVLAEADEELVVALSQRFGVCHCGRNYFLVYNRTCFGFALKILAQPACVLYGCGRVHGS